MSSETQNSWYWRFMLPKSSKVMSRDPFSHISTWKFWDLWVKSPPSEPQVKLHDLLMAILITQKSVENLVVSCHSLVNGGLHHPRWDGHHPDCPHGQMTLDRMPYPAAYSLGELDGYAKMVGDHAISCSQYLNRTMAICWVCWGYLSGPK